MLAQLPITLIFVPTYNTRHRPLSYVTLKEMGGCASAQSHYSGLYEGLNAGDQIALMTRAAISTTPKPKKKDSMVAKA